MPFSLQSLLRTLPRGHVVLLAATSCVLVAVLWLLPGSSDGLVPADSHAAAGTLAPAAAMPSLSPSSSSAGSSGTNMGAAATRLTLPEATAPATAAAQPGAKPAAGTTPQWQEVAVRPGDSLARIFQRQGLPARDLQAVLDSGSLASRLGRIYPGHRLGFQQDKGTLLALRYAAGPLETLEFSRTATGFDGQVLRREPDRVASYREATIEHSLFMASQRIGLDDALTMRLANIFQWDIDFVLDIRKGDAFHVLFEELYLDGEKIGNGRILAAEFVNQGDAYQAVLYAPSAGSSAYFSPDGRSMRKAFLRAPVEFSRISSNFNLRRKHPIHKTVRPHRGIDYVAPTGTPVLAAGDGRIDTVTRDSASGNYITLQHGEQYQTKYLHLSRFATGMREGRKVQQGEVIGYVGATGWATGPHLHYEFLVHGVHQNPRTVALPKADPVMASDVPQFQAATLPLLNRLASLRDSTRLAQAPAQATAARAAGDG